MRMKACRQYDTLSLWEHLEILLLLWSDSLSGCICCGAPAGKEAIVSRAHGKGSSLQLTERCWMKPDPHVRRRQWVGRGHRALVLIRRFDIVHLPPLGLIKPSEKYRWTKIFNKL